MNRDLSKMFLKKSLRDLRDNFKQFISIIFIIGISVTLFVGLQANYESINSRVNLMYEHGNMSDIYVTYDMFNDIDNDSAKIKELFSYDRNIETEKRLYLPASINGVSTNLLISDDYPTLNRACDLYVNNETNPKNFDITDNFSYDENGNFFLIDKRVIRTLYNNGGSERTYKIGDSFDINFDISAYSSQIGETINNYIDEAETFIPLIEQQIGQKIDQTMIDNIKNEITNIVSNDSFNNIKMTANVTNFMTHPENICFDNGGSPVTLMSSKEIYSYLLNLIADKIHELYNQFPVEIIQEILNFMPGLCISNQLLIKFNNKQNLKLTDATDTVRKYLDRKEDPPLGEKYLIIQNSENLFSNMIIQNDIMQAQALAWVFPIVFMLVAVLIAITTISQLILKEHNIIGTMKGLGLSNGEIISHYFLTSFALAFIGCFIGCLIGPLIIPFIMDIKYQMLYSVTATTYCFPVIAALLTTLIIVGAVLLITYIILRKELKISPAESMRPVTPKIKLKPKKKERKHLFVSLKIALRNIKVYKIKSLMVVIGVLGCSTLMVCGFGIDDCITYGINNDITRYYGADILISYTGKDSSIESKILSDETLKSYGTIERSYPIYRNLCSAQYGNSSTLDLPIVIVDQKSYDDKIFDCSFDPNSIAICKGTAKNLGVKLGDKINVKINDVTFEKRVSNIYDYFSIQYVFAHLEDKDFAQAGASPNALYLYTNISTDEAGLLKMSNYIAENISGIATSKTSFQQKATIAGYVTMVSSMTNTIKIFALLLAIVCLLNLALLNFKERTREIATLKVLGLTNSEIGRSLIYESCILATIGAAIGLFLGLPMVMAVLGINQNTLVAFIYYISPLTYGLSFAICIGTALLINYLLGLRIKGVPMVESLKSVE